MTKAKSVHSTQRTIAPKFHQAAKRLPNPPARSLADVDTFPDLYCLTLEGACLDPLIPDGASVVIQKSAAYKVGDVVCIWWRPGFVKPGMYQGWLKRVRLNAPPWVKKFPYSDHPESDVKAIIVMEQLNPPGTYAVPCEHIHAIHKAVGYGPPAKLGGTVRSDRLSPIGDDVLPQLGKR
jgi:hypothetical protein